VGRVARAATLGPFGQLEALQYSLFDRNEFQFEYDEELTLTGEQAFVERRGNCMAFTALFVALARSVGIPVVLVSVSRTPEVDKEGGLVVVNRHVVAGYRAPDQMRLFDFYITSSTPYVHQRVIDDVSASAMFHSNLGGAAIRNGDLDVALYHLELAAGLAPEWGPAWVNLGVARSRGGDRDGALQAYEEALRVEPDNSSALTNIAYVYSEMGLETEARNALKAAAQRTSNPFTLIAMADSEMLRGNFGEAHRYLRKAKWWYRGEPEVYDALARLALREGDQDKADRFVRRAAELRAEEEAGQ
jgi:Flp pilus assembly protein TadD